MKEHAYFVANAFKRTDKGKDLQFFEVYNPWVRYVRAYTFVKKTIDNTEIEALSAEGKNQLPPLLVDRSLSFIGVKSSPRMNRKTEIANPKLPQELSKNGFLTLN